MEKSDVNRIARFLRDVPRAGSAEVCRQFGVSRATFMRAVRALGEHVISRGSARRARYALRRNVRGNTASIPLYRIDAQGAGHVAGALDLTYPDSSTLSFKEPFAWPLDSDGPMRDGWFEGLPYPIVDMRHQGFLGRHFAHLNWHALDVPENLADWSDDDVLHVLATMGSDQPGSYILGERAYQRHMESLDNWETRLIPDDQLALSYPNSANATIAHGVAESSVAGEFPKFTALRAINGEPTPVIVKFSGADNSPAVRRWADLLVCEHLALEILTSELGIASAQSTIHTLAGRTFLELVRFDRQGAFGRKPVCSLGSMNNALLGRAGVPWPIIAGELNKNGWLAADAVSQINRLWWFGRLIANSDMHEGNLSFHPGLSLTPAYDMLPMRYAPQRGGEVPRIDFTPARPMPEEIETWRQVAPAAAGYWKRCTADPRISADFRKVCAENAETLDAALAGQFRESD